MFKQGKRQIRTEPHRLILRKC